jgi:mRNA interferase MazF
MVEYQWHIFWVNLDPIKGSEQSGTRPVLVVSSEQMNQSLPIVGIISLTSLKENRKIYPVECFLNRLDTGLDKDSIAMAHQIRVISKERLGMECGFIESQALREKIKITLKRYLDI